MYRYFTAHSTLHCTALHLRTTAHHFASLLLLLATLFFTARLLYYLHYSLTPSPYYYTAQSSLYCLPSHSSIYLHNFGSSITSFPSKFFLEDLSRLSLHPSYLPPLHHSTHSQSSASEYIPPLAYHICYITRITSQMHCTLHSGLALSHCKHLSCPPLILHIPSAMAMAWHGSGYLCNRSPGRILHLIKQTALSPLFLFFATWIHKRVHTLWQMLKLGCDPCLSQDNVDSILLLHRNTRSSCKHWLINLTFRHFWISIYPYPSSSSNFHFRVGEAELSASAIGHLSCLSAVEHSSSEVAQPRNTERQSSVELWRHCCCQKVRKTWWPQISFLSINLSKSHESDRMPRAAHCSAAGADCHSFMIHQTLLIASFSILGKFAWPYLLCSLPCVLQVSTLIWGHG